MMTTEIRTAKLTMARLNSAFSFSNRSKRPTSCTFSTEVESPRIQQLFSDFGREFDRFHSLRLWTGAICAANDKAQQQPAEATTNSRQADTREASTHQSIRCCGCCWYRCCWCRTKSTFSNSTEVEAAEAKIPKYGGFCLGLKPDSMPMKF